MTGSPLARAASISCLMYSRATQLSSPHEVCQRLIGLEDGFRPLAAECPIDVNHKKRGPLAKPGAGTEPTRGEYGLVALGKKFVPDALVHRRPSFHSIV